MVVTETPPHAETKTTYNHQTIVQLGHITRNNGLCACQNCTWAIFEGALSLELCEMSHVWRGFKYGEKCVMHWPDVSKTRQGIVFVRIINVSVNILVIFELGFWILLASYYPMRCPPILVVSECIQNTCGDSLLHKSLCLFHEMFVFFQIMVVATVEKSIQQLLCQSCCNFLCAGQISDLHQWVFDAMNDEFLCRLSTPTCWTRIVDSAHLIRQNLFSMIFLLWQHIGTSTNKCNYLIFGWNYCNILYLQHVGTHKLNWRSVLILELIFFEWKNMEHTIWNLWVRGGWINKAAIRCAPAWTLWFVWALVGPDKKLVNVCKSRLQLLRTSNTFYACGVSQVALDPCFFSMWCLVM